jgi:hypothetical protein
LVSQLLTEAAVLRRLLYKNKHQHEKTEIYQKLQQVDRLLRYFSFESKDIWKQLQSLQAALSIASKPTLVPQQRKIPSKTCVLELMAVLLGMCRALDALEPASLAAAHSLVAQIEQSYFLSLSLVLLALVSRVRVLSMYFLYEIVQIFNALSELLDVVPENVEVANPKQSWNLPKCLGCSKEPRGRIQLMMSHQLVDGVVNTTGGGATRSRTTPPFQECEDIKSSPDLLGEKGLPVVEDRGLPISREELQFELLMEPSPSQVAQEAPAYERVQLKQSHSSQANDLWAKGSYQRNREQSTVQRGWESWLVPFSASSVMPADDNCTGFQPRKRRRQNRKG